MKRVLLPLFALLLCGGCGGGVDRKSVIENDLPAHITEQFQQKAKLYPASAKLKCIKVSLVETEPNKYVGAATMSNGATTRVTVVDDGTTYYSETEPF